MTRATLGLIAAVGASMLVAACRVGPAVETYTAARNPEGVRIDARTEEGSLAGEIIEVRDTALVALVGGRLVLVPWEALRNLRITGLPTIPMRGHWLTPEHRAAVRQLSRFPQGMTPEIQARFLAHLGQSEIRVMER
jgi:hypothetical protein